MSPDTGNTPDGPGEDAHTSQRLTQAVKGAILDRLLLELGAESTIHRPRSTYTKSDSGLYGKYEKQDADQMLGLIRETIDAALADYESQATPLREAPQPPPSRLTDD